MYASLQERLEANSKPAKCGCRLWTGNVNNDGYPRFSVRIGGKVVKQYAHRAYFELKTETKIPEGMELDHTCVTPRCINERHLEVVTGQENLRRRSQRRKARK